MKVLTTLAVAGTAIAALAVAAPAMAAHCSCAPRHVVHRHYIAPVRHLARHAHYVAPRTIVRTRTVYVTHYVNAPAYEDAGPAYENDGDRFESRVRYEGGPGHRHCRHPHHDRDHDRDWGDNDRGGDDRY